MNITIISLTFLTGFVAGAICFAKYGLSIAGQVRAEVHTLHAKIDGIKAKAEAVKADIKG